MFDQRIKVFSDTLQIGGVIAAAGSVAGLWLPSSVALLLAGVAVCRICWLEDNIHHDLLRNDQVPAGYRACRARRRSILGRLLLPDNEQPTDCPKVLASQLRIQSHAWAAFAWAVLAGAVLSYPAPATMALAALFMAMALRNADYFAWAQTALATGQALPAHLIAGRGPLARLAYSSRQSD